MKDDKHQVQVVVESGGGCRFNYLFTLILLVAGTLFQVNGQCLENSTIFQNGERVVFDVYYKWGIIMAKGGTASITVKEATYNNTPVWHTHLLISTAGMADKFFKVRDTMENYITRTNPRLLFSTKRSDEGGYYQIDNMTYTYKDGKTHVNSFRQNRHTVKFDTTFVGGDCVLDLLAALTKARSFNWQQLEIGMQYPLEVGMGNDMINVSYRYEGQQIVERDNIKYRTRLFVVDIFDEAFTESKAAMEIWIGDDENQIPVRARAKLKIGAMELYYKSSQNLRHPLSCRVQMPK